MCFGVELSQKNECAINFKLMVFKLITVVTLRSCVQFQCLRSSQNEMKYDSSFINKINIY